MIWNRPIGSGRFIKINTFNVLCVFTILGEDLLNFCLLLFIASAKQYYVSFLKPK
jgi:hypothetical protein